MEVLDWDLPEDDFKRLCNLNPQIRMLDASFLCHPDGPYRSLADLWDE